MGERAHLEVLLNVWICCCAPCCCTAIYCVFKECWLSDLSLKKKKEKIERLESKTPPLLRWRFRQQHAQELRMKAGWSIFKTRTGSCHNNLRRRTYLFAFLNQKQPIPSIHRILTHMFDHLSTVCSFSKLQQVFLFVQEVLNPINCCFPCVPSLCIVFCYCENPAGHRIQQRLNRFMGVFGSGGRAIICQLEGCWFDLWPPICIVICMTQNSTENSSERLSVNSNPNGFL